MSITLMLAIEEAEKLYTQLDELDEISDETFIEVSKDIGKLYIEELIDYMNTIKKYPMKVQDFKNNILYKVSQDISDTIQDNASEHLLDIFFLLYEYDSDNESE